MEVLNFVCMDQQNLGHLDPDPDSLLFTPIWVRLKIHISKNQDPRSRKISVQINNTGEEVTLDVWIVDAGVEEVGGLDQGEAAVAGRRYAGVHTQPVGSLPNSQRDTKR